MSNEFQKAMADYGPFGVVMLFVVIVATLALQCAAEAMVLWKLWGWFAVPAGLPMQSPIVLAGLNVLIGVFTWRYIPNPNAKPFEALNQWALVCSTALAVGWLLSMWVPK